MIHDGNEKKRDLWSKLYLFTPKRDHTCNHEGKYLLQRECYLAITCKFDHYNHNFSGFFFLPDELSGSKHKNTHHVLWIVKYYHLQAAVKQTADD